LQKQGIVVRTLGAVLMAASLVMGMAAEASPRWAIVVHGGAGVIERKDLTADQERAYREAMRKVTDSGAKLLAAGKPALDVIEATIGMMEDDPLFNAGRGAVFTAQGRNELDAAIMDGKTLKAGSVAGVTHSSSHFIGASSDGSLAARDVGGRGCRYILDGERTGAGGAGLVLHPTSLGRAAEVPASKRAACAEPAARHSRERRSR
jgi:hypothetical protein